MSIRTCCTGRSRGAERLHRERRARLLGVSNISHDQLVTLCQSATVALVQNRCFARTGWDREVRRICRERGMVYQGFSLLTANQRELRGATVAAIARRLGATIPQVVFRFALAIGMVALTGTSDRTHMQQDLAAVDLALTESDVAALERLR